MWHLDNAPIKRPVNDACWRGGPRISLNLLVVFNVCGNYSMKKACQVAFAMSVDEYFKTIQVLFGLLCEYTWQMLTFKLMKRSDKGHLLVWCKPVPRHCRTLTIKVSRLRPVCCPVHVGVARLSYTRNFIGMGTGIIGIGVLGKKSLKWRLCFCCYWYARGFIEISDRDYKEIFFKEGPIFAVPANGPITKQCKTKAKTGSRGRLVERQTLKAGQRVLLRLPKTSKWTKVPTAVVDSNGF